MEQLEYSTEGRHVAVDCWGVSARWLNDIDFLKTSAGVALENCGATILGVMEKKFDPQGVTILYLLSESHFSIHTYPEKGFCAIDCYTCGNTVDPKIATDIMISVLSPKSVHEKILIRGLDEILVN